MPTVNESFREFNFMKPVHITTKFDTVVIMGEEFEVNMFEEVSHLPYVHHKPSPPSAAGQFVTQKQTWRKDWIPIRSWLWLLVLPILLCWTVRAGEGLTFLFWARNSCLSRIRWSSAHFLTLLTEVSDIFTTKQVRCKINCLEEKDFLVYFWRQIFYCRHACQHHILTLNFARTLEIDTYLVLSQYLTTWFWPEIVYREHTRILL